MENVGNLYTLTIGNSFVIWNSQKDTVFLDTRTTALQNSFIRVSADRGDSPEATGWVIWQNTFISKLCQSLVILG